MSSLQTNFRSKVIEKAKQLKRQGTHYRYFSVDGEIWECYQAEYLPDVGERAWLASPINPYIIHEHQHVDQPVQMDALTIAKEAMEIAQRHLYAATVQFQPTDDAIIMRHVEDAYRAIRECRITLK